MQSTLLTIGAVLGALLFLAGLVVLLVRKFKLFRHDKRTVQIRTINGMPQAIQTVGSGDAGSSGVARLRETSAPAWACRVIELGAATVSIGRALDNDIVLPEDPVSSQHCRIVRQADGGYELVDLGSTNKTWVNGHKVKSTPLRNGDQIRVGTTTFVFEA
jgi:hypothetical protein